MAPEQSLAERRFPNRHELDAAAPDNPVWIRSIWGLWNNTPPFVHVLNSAGIRACGITRHTPAPTSTVEIERDSATGDLTGRILSGICGRRPSSPFSAPRHALPTRCDYAV
jgi:predicted amidohydrolase YtcJ